MPWYRAWGVCTAEDVTSQHMSMARGVFDCCLLMALVNCCPCLPVVAMSLHGEIRCNGKLLLPPESQQWSAIMRDAPTWVDNQLAHMVMGICCGSLYWITICSTQVMGGKQVYKVYRTTIHACRV